MFALQVEARLRAHVLKGQRSGAVGRGPEQLRTAFAALDAENLGVLRLDQFQAALRNLVVAFRVSVFVSTSWLV